MAKKKAEPESNGHADDPLPVADSNLSALEKAHYAEIREKEKDVRRLACIADDKKADASAAKKAFEAADLALRNLISRGPYQAELPFPEEKPEEWKSISLEELGISQSMLTGLEDAGFKTIGDLAAHTEAGKELTEINGIGPKKAEDLAARLQSWWDDHPEYVTDDSNEDGESDELNEEVGDAFRKAGLLA